MIKTQGLTHIHLAVRDIQRSLAFYSGVFGMEVRFWDGPSMVFLGTPGAQDTFTLRQADAGEPVGPGGGFGHFGFRLQQKEGLDAAVEDVLGAGGLLIKRGEHQPGLPYAYVSDPDGFVIEL